MTNVEMVEVVAAILGEKHPVIEENQDLYKGKSIEESLSLALGKGYKISRFADSSINDLGLVMENGDMAILPVKEEETDSGWFVVMGEEEDSLVVADHVEDGKPGRERYVALDVLEDRWFSENGDRILYVVSKMEQEEDSISKKGQSEVSEIANDEEFTWGVLQVAREKDISGQEALIRALENYLRKPTQWKRLKETPEARFLREVVSPAPDYGLRSRYREEVLKLIPESLTKKSSVNGNDALGVGSRVSVGDDYTKAGENNQGVVVDVDSEGGSLEVQLDSGRRVVIPKEKVSDTEDEEKVRTYATSILSEELGDEEISERELELEKAKKLINYWAMLSREELMAKREDLEDDFSKRVLDILLKMKEDGIEFAFEELEKGGKLWYPTDGWGVLDAYLVPEEMLEVEASFVGSKADLEEDLEERLLPLIIKAVKNSTELEGKISGVGEDLGWNLVYKIGGKEFIAEDAMESVDCEVAIEPMTDLYTVEYLSGKSGTTAFKTLRNIGLRETVYDVLRVQAFIPRNCVEGCVPELEATEFEKKRILKAIADSKVYMRIPFLDEISEVRLI